MKILFQIPVNIRLKIGNVSGGSLPDTHKLPLFWKTNAWTKKYSLICESIIYDGADDVIMLSVHCIFLIKFSIIRNQYVRRTRQFCSKWPILRRIFQKILIYIAYTLLPYWKHVNTYQNQLETKIYWVRNIFKCLGRVFLGISHFTGECALTHFSVCLIIVGCICWWFSCAAEDTWTEVCIKVYNGKIAASFEFYLPFLIKDYYFVWCLM